MSAYPIRLPRDLASAKGTAGSPTALAGSGTYRWSQAYPVLYSTEFETALIRVELSDGTVGWGEAQAPLAPEVACTIVEKLLSPAITGEEFDGTPVRIQDLWNRMYATMRVRGQTGGFMLDAISGVDLALWDAAGKMAGKPVCELLSAHPKSRIPAYLSGTSGSTIDARAQFAAQYRDRGLNLVKLYFESDWESLLELMDSIPSGMQVAVDALWHMPPADAIDMARDLDARNARWLECPLYPEDIEGHAELTANIHTPLAIGESYRTVHELRPFLERRVAKILQPDLGRSGITESRRIAQAHDGEIIPHVSIAMGPQIAAAIHFAAATANCSLCEFNPNVLETANSFLVEPLRLEDGAYIVPRMPGLGVTWNGKFPH